MEDHTYQKILDSLRSRDIVVNIPHLTRLKDVIYRSRLNILIIALCCLGYIWLRQPASVQTPDVMQTHADISTSTPSIHIDISGSVIKPGLYTLAPGSHLNDGIDTAGGLTSDADYDFFARNYNLASTLSDGQKVYIPSRYEVNVGIYREKPKLIYGAYTSDAFTSSSSSSQTQISVNTSSQVELESLPGIGTVTAQRIISSRPYAALNDLTTKGILKQSVYDKILPSLKL